jgi:hypothetical protein
LTPVLLRSTVTVPVTVLTEPAGERLALSIDFEIVLVVASILD